MREVLVEGFYELQAETSLDVLQHFDTPEDLLERKPEHLEGEDALVERIRSAASPLVVREQTILRRFRASGSG